MNNDNNNQNDNRKNHTPECTLKSSITLRALVTFQTAGEERENGLLTSFSLEAPATLAAHFGIDGNLQNE